VAVAYVRASNTGFGTAATSLAKTGMTMTSGNTIFVYGSFQHVSGQTISIVTTGGTGSDTATQLYFNNALIGSNSTDFYCYVFAPIGAGRTGITLNFGVSTAFGDWTSLEVSGLPAPITNDQTFWTGASSAANIQFGTTATLASSNEVSLIYCAGNNAAGAFTAPFTDIGSTPSTSDHAGYIISTTNTAIVTGTQTKGTNTSWASFLLLYYTGTAAAATKAGTMSLMGVG